MRNVHLLPLLAALVFAPVSQPGETRSWNGGHGLWSDPANWTPAGVPAGADEVHINAGSVQVNVPVTIENRLVWNGGGLHSGALRVAAGATAELGGTGDKSVQNFVLVNAGELRVTEGRLACVFTGYSQSAVITNEAGGVFELRETAQVAQANPGGWAPASLLFVNEGVLRKTGAGASQMSGMPFCNRGTTEVQAGSLLWTGGGMVRGVFKVPSQAALTFHDGLFDLAGSRWEGAGPVRVGGNTSLLGAFTAENFGFDAGVIQGDFEVAGSFTWSGGMFTSARVRLGAGQHLITGADTKEMLGANLSNAGRLVIAAARIGLRLNGYGQAVSLTNEVGATMTLLDGATIEQRNEGGWPAAQLVLVNAGTLRSEGTGTNRLQNIPLNNHGLVEVAEGRLVQLGGGQSTGRWTVAADAASEWQGGHYTLAEAQVSGPGPTVLNGAFTLQGAASADWFEFRSGTIAGTVELRGGLRWTGGVLGGATLRLGTGHHWISGDHGQTMQNAVLVNGGHLVAEAAGVALRFTGYNQSAAITNESGAVLELRGGTRVHQANPGGWAPAALVLANHGTLRTTGETTNHLENIPLNNSGTIEVLEGVFRQSGGGVSPGQVQIAATARHDLSGGTYNLDGGQWTGSGAARIVAITRLLGTFHANRFELALGDLDGDFDVSGGFAWTGGRLGGVRARLGPGAHRIHGEADKVMQMATLSNAGDLVLDNCGLALQFTGYNQYAMLTNELGGTIEFAGTARIEQRNGGGWEAAGIGLFNDGTFRVSGAGLKSLARVPLHNRGRIEILDGTLQQTGGGISPGSVEVAAPGRFEFAGGTFELGGSRLLGPGPMAVVGTATILGEFAAENFRLERGDLSGACRISGSFHWIGGNLVAAQVRLGPGEHRIAGPDSKVMHGSSLANAGRLVFEPATVGLLFTGYSQSAVLTNEAGGELELADGARLEQRNGGGWQPARIGLVNEGTLRKGGAGSAVLAAVPLVNWGQCQVSDGTLRVESHASFGEAGQLTLRLGGAPALEVTGTASLAGGVAVNTPPGFAVSAGAVFTPLTAGALSGRFANDISVNPGHVFEYANAYSGASLTLTAQSRLDQPLQLLGPRIAGDRLEFDILGQAGLVYAIESSVDLIQWHLEQTIVSAADAMSVGQAATGRPGRFFRVGLFP